MKSKLILIGSLAVLYFLFFSPEPKPIEYQDAAKLTTLPIQKETKEKPFTFKGFNVQPLAEFTLTARVLSNKSYKWSWGNEADLSPVDLALGWGPMADSNNLKNIKVTQRGRWYYWRANGSAISRKDIEHNSGNMHIIPATDGVYDKVTTLSKGHVLELSGYLVEVTKEGWTWRSSLSRTDTGDKACEVFYVKQVKVIPSDKK